MFPLFATVNGLIAIATFSAWIVITRSSSGIGNPAKKYFGYTYLFVALYFVLHSFPELFIADGEFLQKLNIISKIALFSSLTFLLASALEIGQRQKWKKVVIPAFLFLVAIAFFAAIFTFSPAKEKIIEGMFVYWQPGCAQWITALEGFLAIVPLLFTVSIFSWKNKVTTNKSFKNRTQFLIIGFSLLTTSIVLNFVFLPLEINPLFSLVIASGSVIFAAVGIFLTVKGLVYQPR